MTVETVFDFYKYFYSKINRSVSSVTMTEADRKLIQSFLSNFNGGESALFEYMVAQFYYWHDKDTRFGRGKIMLNWVIGGKAFDRWRSMAPSNRFDQIKSEYGISKHDLIKDNSHVGIKDISSMSDVDRALFHNTDIGLIHCSDFTPMHDSSSSYCNTCINSSLCIQIMGNKYTSVRNVLN